MEFASLMQMFGQQVQRLNEPALANPLLKPPVAGLVRWILRRHLGPLRTTAQNPEHAIKHRTRLVPGTAAVVLTPRLTPALRAAVALTAITANANPEHRPAIGVAAKPKPQNNFLMSRHPCALTAFDNGSGSCQGKSTPR
jgi:hypothetical protein